MGTTEILVFMSVKVFMSNESENVCHSVMSESATPWTVACVHEILQAKILEWFAISYSRGSS